MAQMIRLPIADEREFGGQRGRLVLASRGSGLTSTRSRAMRRPESATSSMTQVGLAVVEAALDGRADARGDGRIADVQIERDVNAHGARPRQRQRALHDRGDAVAIDVLHREDMHARFADAPPLESIEIADADEHGRSGLTFGAPRPMPASSAGSAPSSAASGMPCTLPLVVVAGVFMSPWASTQSRPIVPPCSRRSRPMRRPIRPPASGRRRARSGRAPVLVARGDLLVEPLTDPRDLPDELLARIALACGFRGWGPACRPGRPPRSPSRPGARRARRCGWRTGPCRRPAA